MPPLTMQVDIGQAGDLDWGQVLDTTPGGVEKTADVPDLTAPSVKPEVQGKQETNPNVGGAGGKAAQAIELARSQLGVKYVYGGSAWGQGLDCSGLIQEAYKRAGVQLPRVTYDQVNSGQPVSDISQARPGDLIFCTGDRGQRKNGHVGIYIGNGQWIAAPHTGTVVQIQNIPKNITAIRRVA